LRAHALLPDDRQAQRAYLRPFERRGTPLRAEEETIASVLKRAGYATGRFGKWGVGGRGSTSVPEKHGFDVFVGHYDQVHAHSEINDGPWASVAEPGVIGQ
jgi:arylsulfatase A-like enzyme